MPEEETLNPDDYDMKDGEREFTEEEIARVLSMLCQDAGRFGQIGIFDYTVPDAYPYFVASLAEKEAIRRDDHPLHSEVEQFLQALVRASFAELTRRKILELILDDEDLPAYTIHGHSEIMLMLSEHNPIQARRWEEIRERQHLLEKMPYPVYLQTDEWQKRRQQHIAWAGARCQVCNASQDDCAVLNVHHRTYKRRGRERASDLIVLCSDCHRLFHVNRKIQG